MKYEYEEQIQSEITVRETVEQEPPRLERSEVSDEPPCLGKMTALEQLEKKAEEAERKHELEMERMERKHERDMAQLQRIHDRVTDPSRVPHYNGLPKSEQAWLDDAAEEYRQNGESIWYDHLMSNAAKAHVNGEY